MSLETRLAALVGRLGQETKAARPARPGGFVAGSSGTRRAQFAFGCGGMDTVVTHDTGHQRMPFQLPVGVKQWRLCISNAPPMGAVTAPAINCTGVWFGPAYRDPTTGNPNGWYGAGNPTQAIAAFTIPANGGEYRSPWVTTASLLPSDPSKAYVISMGWTKTVNGSTIYRGCGGAANNTTAADAAASGPIIGINQGVMFSVAIEYEFAGSNKIVLAGPGDSLTEGYGPTLNMNNWQHRFSMREKLPMVTTADFGSSAQQWAAAAITEPGYKRIIDGGFNIDAAIVHLGTNDLNSGRTLAQIQADLYAVRNKLVTNLGIKEIYFTTIAPRNLAAAPEAVRKTVNTWLTSNQPDVTEVFDFKSALETTIDGVTLRTDSSFDGIHWTNYGTLRASLAIPSIAP